MGPWDAEEAVGEVESTPAVIKRPKEMGEIHAKGERERERRTRRTFLRAMGYSVWLRGEKEREHHILSYRTEGAPVGSFHQPTRRPDVLEA